MDRILIILKKENGPRASSAPALGLNTIIFKYVYWYMKQISGERLQDHWSSGLMYVVDHHGQLNPKTGSRSTCCKPSPLLLTYIILTSFCGGDIGKQFCPRCDVAECGVPSWVILFA